MTQCAFQRLHTGPVVVVAVQVTMAHQNGVTTLAKNSSIAHLNMVHLGQKIQLLIELTPTITLLRKDPMVF